MRSLARTLTLAMALSPACMVGQAHAPRAGVQFYFSDAGGSHERITLDYVTSSAWTAEYDVIAKNTRSTPISFDGGCLMIGFGMATAPGLGAQPILGSDRITLFNVGAAASVVNQNPNITSLASWFVGDTTASLVGGRGPSPPALRPYGFNIPIDPINRDLVTISPDETMFIARIKFRDNGLFAAQTSHWLVVYDYDPSPSVYATTSLMDASGDPYYIYHDGPNWETNSRLRLAAVPEPATIAPLCLGFLLLRFRRGRKPPVCRDRQ